MKGLAKSFVYAVNGIKYAVTAERNFRIHITAIFFVLYFSVLYGLSAIQYSILSLILAIIPASELFNTALEKVVDMIFSGYDENAKIVKDVAAGAVLVLALGSVGVAVSMFSDVNKLRFAVEAAVSLPHLPILSIAAVFGIYFIFFFGRRCCK